MVLLTLATGIVTQACLRALASKHSHISMGPTSEKDNSEMVRYRVMVKSSSTLVKMVYLLGSLTVNSLMVH
jgi:hypothetical protein